jgi:hypothetical protein
MYHALIGEPVDLGRFAFQGEREIARKPVETQPPGSRSPAARAKMGKPRRQIHLVCVFSQTEWRFHSRVAAVAAW